MKKAFKDILLGIYAGFAIALGGLLNILANAIFSSNAMLGRIVGSLLFPIGLTLVCFLGLNLFTGKIGYLFDNKKDYLLFLLYVYIGNLIGSLIFGSVCLLAFKGTPIYQTIEKICIGKMPSLDLGPLVKMFAGAVLCGALVYLAVLLYKISNKTIMKIIGIFVPIFLFVYLKFDHCVANMFYFMFGLSYGNYMSYINLLIVTLGNSVGAILLNESKHIIEAYKIIKANKEKNEQENS